MSANAPHAVRGGSREENSASRTGTGSFDAAADGLSIALSGTPPMRKAVKMCI
jgi:hypothetical protein